MVGITKKPASSQSSHGSAIDACNTSTLTGKCAHAGKCKHCNCVRNKIGALYRIRQNIRGGKLSRFSRILAKCESFTIESFPSSQLENFIIIP